MPCSGGGVEYPHGHKLTWSSTSFSDPDFPILDSTCEGSAIFCQCEALVFLAIISHFYPPLMCTSQLASLFA